VKCYFMGYLLEDMSEHLARESEGIHELPCLIYLFHIQYFLYVGANLKFTFYDHTSGSINFHCADMSIQQARNCYC
jgi:hypothetical protein